MPSNLYGDLTKQDFDFHLPPELIAQYALPDRSASRLLTLDKSSGAVAHRLISDLPQLLPENTAVVINNTKVIPARLLGVREDTGGKAEVFLYRFSGENPLVWEALTKLRKGIQPGMGIALKGGVVARCVEVLSRGRSLIRFENIAPEDVHSWLEKAGRTPLPPYIRRDPEAADRQRYQTVYAGPSGAVAAPTAGLHFTTELLEHIKALGIPVIELTLHVSLGTFLPLKVDHLSEVKLHAEQVEISPEAAAAVNAARAESRKILAVGTTTVRSLECAVQDDGTLHAFTGETDMFIAPGYDFKVVDQLLTNFHLPQSSLLMLVAAFAGHQQVLEAYKQAVKEKYRFFSYGDAMLIR